MHRTQRIMQQSKNIDYSDTDSILCIPCIISTKHKLTNTYQLPKCASFFLGKMERIPASTTQTTCCQRGKLCRDDILHGDGNSMDQFVVSVKVRTLKTSSNDSVNYNGGRIYVDNSSDCIFSHN